MKSMQFSREEYIRYNRHLLLPEFDLATQKKLKAARVLMVGAGGLGCPVLQYLAAAGVGEIGIVDDDVVELSNLQRQILYREADLGQRKAEIAARRLQELNSFLKTVALPYRLTAGNALELMEPYQVIVDGSDNFPTRYLVNDACCLLNKPLIYGSVYQFQGQVAVFNLPREDGRNGPNYRDLFPEPPPPELVPNCAEGGILGVLPGLVGTIQAIETLKVITGIGQPLSGELLLINARNFEFRRIHIPRDPQNPVSGEKPSIHHLIDYEAFCRTPVSGTRHEELPQITAAQFHQWLEEKRDFQLIDVRQPHEKEIVTLGGELIPPEKISVSAGKIERRKPVILYCRTGARSARALRELREKYGFTNLLNLQGGLLAYISKFRPDLPVY